MTLFHKSGGSLRSETGPWSCLRTSGRQGNIPSITRLPERIWGPRKPACQPVWI